MDLKKRIKNFFADKFTLLVIPHNTKNTRQIKIHKFILTTTFTLLSCTFIFFVVSAVYLYDKNETLNEEVSIKNDKINNLTEITEHQKSEIEDLQSTSKVVMDKLSQLYYLEDQVRNLVGLESNDKEDSNSNPPSRSYNREITNTENTNLNLEDITNEDSVDTITNLIELETENYDNLITEVEKQLKYLEAKPDKWPVQGTITSKFGYRTHPIYRTRQFHKGIDTANKTGTNIVAAGSGIVTYSGWNGGYGRVIIVSHGYGYKSVYAHNDKNIVSVGDRVGKGDIIAKLGNSGRSTGPHLHFEVHYNGSQIDPLKILN